MIIGTLRLLPDQSPDVPAGYEATAGAGPSRLTSSQPDSTSTKWWERPSPPTPPETVEADQLLPARVPTVPQPILGDTARRRRSREPGPFTTAVYLSPDHMHLAVVMGYEKISVYKLDGQRLGEKVAQHDVDRHPRVTWSASGKMLTFVDGGSGVATVLDVTTGETTPLGSLAVAVAPYPDGSRFAVVDESQLTIWNAKPPRLAAPTSLR
jgi:hypothetical protein